MKKSGKLKFGRAILTLLVVLSMTLSVTIGMLTASGADDSVMVSVKTNSDVNPFIRVALNRDTFATGGPFTIRCDVNILSFQKMKADGNIFYNIIDGRDPSQMAVWQNVITKKSDGWIEMVNEKGGFITFNNIDTVLISGAFEKFGLFQFGTYYAKAEMQFKNFRILNAQGKVMYSWDTDPLLTDMENLKDAAGPVMYTATFGDGSADLKVGRAGNSSSSSSSSSSNIYEEDDKPSDSSPSGSSSGTTSDNQSNESSGSADNSSADESETSSNESVDASGDSSSPSNVSTPDQKGDEKGSNSWIIWVCIGGAILVLAGAYLVLWKMNKLPWNNKDEEC